MRHPGLKNRMIWTILTRDSEVLMALEAPGMTGTMKAAKMEEITGVPVYEVALACEMVNCECNSEGFDH